LTCGICMLCIRMVSSCCTYACRSVPALTSYQPAVHPSKQASVVQSSPLSAALSDEKHEPPPAPEGYWLLITGCMCMHGDTHAVCCPAGQSPASCT
jgi:hypothetical protein